MINENFVASIMAALTQPDSDAWCKRALARKENDVARRWFCNSFNITFHFGGIHRHEEKNS